MVITTRLKNQHLLWRAAFGPMAENAADLDNISHKKLWKQLLETSSKDPEKIDVASNIFDGLLKGVMDVGSHERAHQRSEKSKYRHQSEEDLKNLNLRWIAK